MRSNIAESFIFAPLIGHLESCNLSTKIPGGSKFKVQYGEAPNKKKYRHSQKPIVLNVIEQGADRYIEQKFEKSSL